MNQTDAVPFFQCTVCLTHSECTVCLTHSAKLRSEPKSGKLIFLECVMNPTGAAKEQKLACV